MYLTAAKNDMLDALGITHVSAHSAYPGTTGANLITGSTSTISVAAASGEVSVGGTTNLAIPAGNTVRWIVYWKASAPRCQAPNGGLPKEFVVTPTTDTVQSPAHGWSDTQPVVFYGATPPAPLVAGTVYYVRDSATDSFKVAATAGGAAIDLTTAGSGGCMVSAITESVYASAGTHTVASSTFGLPF